MFCHGDTAFYSCSDALFDGVEGVGYYVYSVFPESAPRQLVSHVLVMMIAEYGEIVFHFEGCPLKSQILRHLRHVCGTFQTSDMHCPPRYYHY